MDLGERRRQLNQPHVPYLPSTNNHIDYQFQPVDQNLEYVNKPNSQLVKS